MIRVVKIVVFITFLLLFYVLSKTKSPTKKFEGPFVFNVDLNSKKLSPLLREKEFGPLIEKELRIKNHKELDVFFFFIDALRRDFITQEDAPHLYEFMNNEAFKFNHHWANATGTQHSTFGLFYSRPSYELMPYLKQSPVLGSPFLRILRDKLKYNLFAFGEYYSCVDQFIGGDQNSIRGWKSIEQLVFGYKSYLEKRCFNNEPINFQYANQAHSGNRDVLVMEDLFQLLDVRTKEKEQNDFYLIYLYALHDPYSWSDVFPKDQLIIPSRLGQGFFTNKDYSNEGIAIYRNNYRNSVRHLDRLFMQFKEKLKEKGKWNNSLIVLLGDHGDSLGEKGVYNHGESLNREEIETPILIKLPLEDHYSYSKMIKAKSITHLDVFPSLIDYLGISWKQFPKGLFWGSPIWKKSHDQHVITEPNNYWDSSHLVLINPEYKVEILLDNQKQIHQSHGFHVLRMTDHHDNPLIEAENMDASYRKKLEEDFSTILNKMFR